MISMKAGGFLWQGSPPSIIKLYKEWLGKPPGSTFQLIVPEITHAFLSDLIGPKGNLGAYVKMAKYQIMPLQLTNHRIIPRFLMMGYNFVVRGMKMVWGMK